MVLRSLGAAHMNRRDFLVGAAAASVAGAAFPALSQSGFGEISMVGWSLGGSANGRAFQEAATTFSTGGTQVGLENVPWDNYISVVSTRFRAGRMADTLQLIPGTLHDAIFPTLRKFSKTDYPELANTLTLWEFATERYDTPDSQVGLPIGVQGTMAYTNKVLFENAGLDPEWTPATWEELAEACEKLKAAGITPIAMSAGPYQPFFMYAGLLAQLFPDVQDITDFRAGRITLSDERFLTALNFLTDAGAKGWFGDSFVSRSDDEAEAEFAQGRAGISFGAVAGLSTWPVWDEKLGAGNYKPFLTPLLPGGKMVAYVTPDMLISESGNAKNPDGARAWLGYLAGPEGQKIRLRVGGAMPNLPDIDVADVTGSAGAVAVYDLIKGTPGNESALDFVSAAAGNVLFQQLGQVMRNGGAKEFLEALEAQN